MTRIRQLSNDPAVLKAAAIEAKPELDALAQRIAERSNGRPLEARIKDDARREEKVRYETDGCYDGVVDYVAGAVAHDTAAQATAAAVDLAESEGHRILRLRNRLINPSRVGYSDIVANIRFSNGHIGELQLHAQPMLDAKQAEQALYTLRRSIEATGTLHSEPLLAALRGAAVAVYDIAHQSVAEGRQLTDKERRFIEDVTNPKRYVS
jgi:hypothetical protein